MKKTSVLRSVAIVLATFFSSLLFAQSAIEGKVLDKKTKEPLVGASIFIEGTSRGTTTDIDGNFQLKGLQAGKYTLSVSYVSYKKQRLSDIKVQNSEPTMLEIEMEEAELMLQSVQVVAQHRTDTELSLLKSVRTALQVVNGISSQQIGKTLDRDAAEVVKRIPGVTVQDDRFVVVRGLNQRYNNVWLNNASTPSSETDVKAFSFDAVPSNMIDNIMIYKTGSPELSAEATGGFVKIFTKNIPEENFQQIEYSFGYNDQTTFKDSYHLPTQTLDVFGLGSLQRDLPANFPANLNSLSIQQRDAAALKLNNHWVAQPYTALPNQKLTFSIGRKWNLKEGKKIGNITSLTYSNTSSSRFNMENNMYERFDPITETPVYLYNYAADIYSTDFKIGLMHNWAYIKTNGTKIEFKNLLNQIGVDKTSNTFGWNNYRQGNFKYFSNQYSARTTYSGQLSGNHKLKNNEDNKLDWNVGYAYANRIEPDRQNWSMKETQGGIYEYVLPDVPSINELGRLYMTNHENVVVSGINHEKKFQFLNTLPVLKSGLYGEFKSRNFSERSITYRKAYGPLGNDEINALDFESLFTEAYLGQGKVISVDEQTNVANTYKAQNWLGAGYLSITLPAGKFNLSGGIRAEYNRLMLDGYYNPTSPVHVDNPTLNIFPSINTSYNLSDKSLVRLAYAHTINRPEFREVSPLSYYDFTEKNSVRGNPNLQDASIQNIDLRFENYPSPTETFSLAAFYKHFTHPIEMVNNGVGNDFSFGNAQAAVNYGLELEAKKSLEKLIGLKNFTLQVNASYIFSKVEFADKANEQNRPLQGQSPYVINAALFYQNDKAGLSTSVMYNVMGKRILAAAQLNQGEVVIPDIYEMPRHVVDFTLNKKLGNQMELKFGIKDLLAQNYKTQQTYEYEKDGTAKKATLTNQSYNLGRTFSLALNWKF